MQGWVSIALTLVINIGSLGYVYGSMSVRLSYAEQQVQELRITAAGSTRLTTEVEVMKGTLASIEKTLIRLETSIAKRK